MSDRQIELHSKSIFLSAAAYIREYGWQVSGMGNHGESRCSMGALQSVGPKGRWNFKVASLMYARLTEQLNGVSLTEFNEKWRSGEKVAQLFERTAKALN